MTFLRIVFPFTVGGVRPEVNVRTMVERKEDLISFGLEYDINVSVEDAELKSREEVDGSFIYVYKFNDLNVAINFMDTKTVYAVQDRRLVDVDVLEREMDMFMERYEAGEKRCKKKTRKTVVTGEDGFMRYV